MPNLDAVAYEQLAAYNDYAITGTNCYVYMTSTIKEVRNNIKDLPVIAVGYEIQQQKAPIYGYADVGPRTIARGTRIVSGQLIIAHFEAGALAKRLFDSQRKLYNTPEHLSLDEELRMKYWNTRNWEDWMKDPQRKNFNKQEHLFYAHPNFDISIVYGEGDFRDKIDTTVGAYTTETWSARDINPLYRLNSLSPISGAPAITRETIVGVQLNGKQKTVAADGDIIVEAYSFLAYDVLDQ